MGGVANVAGNAASSIGGGVAGLLAAPGQLLFGKTPPNPQSQVNSISPQLLQMQQQQDQTAINYKNNLTAYENQQQNSAADASRQSLAQTLAGTTSNSNARGMLYGSYNQGQQAQATAQNQSALQQTNANINTNAENTLAGLQNQALGTGLAVNQAQQQQNAAAYQQALAQQQINSSYFGDIMQGAGTAIGLLA